MATPRLSRQVPPLRPGVVVFLLVTIASTATAQWPYTLNIHFTCPTYSACLAPEVSDGNRRAPR